MPRAPRDARSVGAAQSEHYALAWLDRWLKAPAESGYATADARLLADAAHRPEMSVYYRNARSFPDRTGRLQLCEDVRAGCTASAAPSPTASPTPTPTRAAPPQPRPAGPTTAAGPPLAATGGAPLLGLTALALLTAGLAARRRTPSG